MLVLSRHKDESIMIGEQIEVSIVDIRSDKVRIGVTAPKNVSVHRREIYEQIKRENQAAAQMQPADLKSPADSRQISLAVLVSGGGTTLANLLDRISDRSLNAAVNLVIGSRPGIMGVQRAAKAGIPNCVIDRNQFPDPKAFSRQVFDCIDRANVDLVCLGGWLSLLEIPERWRGRVMNIHPALLPGFGGKGMFGRHVHEAVLAAGCKVSGCTVHFVDDQYDAGPIILQRTCPVLGGDTPQLLAVRVFEQECIAYPEAIRLFQYGKLRLEGNRVLIQP